MKRAVAAVMMAGLTSLAAQAQLSVLLRADKETYLLYEPIPLVVGVRNGTGHTIQLTPQADRPWLDFMVLAEDNHQITALGTVKETEPVLVPPGKTISRSVDILPLYDVRQRGEYRIQARVRVDGAEAVSAPVKITVMEGRQLWAETVALPGRPQGQDEYRTYSLLVRRNDREELLHVCVRDEPKQLIYGVLTLGGFIPLTPPTARVDKAGNLHVLYQNAPRSFGYVVVDPGARQLTRVAYLDRLTKPRLVTDAGTVRVLGGEEVKPRSDRVMTEEELAPPPPPPPPKKKWWQR